MKTYTEKIAEINELIPDKCVQSIIFNFGQNYSSFLSDEKRCLTYFSNLLIFSSTVVLNAFISWKNDKNNKFDYLNYSNSFIRLYNMLNRVYDSAKLNSDFIDDVIINLEIDYLLDNNIPNSFVRTIGIRDFFSFPYHNNNLSKYIYMLKQKRISSKYTSSYGYKELIECIKMFPYLKNTYAELYENNIYTKNEKSIYGIKLNFENNSLFNCLDLNYSICVHKNCVFYMEDINIYDPKKLCEDKKKRQVLQINYSSFDSPDCFRVNLCDKSNENFIDEKYYAVCDTIIEDFLIDYDIVNNYTNEQSNVFFKDYLYINNGYIKFLSLIISDTLSTETKKAILSKYRVKYNDFFKQMRVFSLFTYENEICYRWDEIILFLFFEEGIYDFLHFLLTKECYKNFILSFKRRFDEKKINELIDSDDFITNLEKNIQYLSESNKKDCQAKALIILASKLFAFRDWTSEKNYYPATIEDTIKELMRVYKSKIWDDREKILFFLNTLFQVVIFIVTFYKGILEYANEKKIMN